MLLVQGIQVQQSMTSVLAMRKPACQQYQQRLGRVAHLALTVKWDIVACIEWDATASFGEL